jgi:histidinol-phosphate aminotransferase
MNFERDNIKALHAYTPGEQPQEAGVIKLNTNENPYAPSPKVMQAIAAVLPEQLRKYPPPSAMKFRQTAGKLHGVSPEQIVATNGGDELLRLAFTVFCDPQKGDEKRGGFSYPRTQGGVGVAEPSYSLYPVLADIHDSLIARVPLNEDWSIPADWAQKLNDAGCRLGLIVNPHAPSGHLESLEALEKQARAFKGVLMIDEAYVDFAGTSALGLLDEKRGLKNVLILRTLSKGYSLAGLRFGYGIGHVDLIAALNKAKDSYNTDMLSQAAAIAALEDQEYAKGTWKKVLAERGRLMAELRNRGWTTLPSASNFILVTPHAGKTPAKKIYESLKEAGILVRYFDQDRLRDKLRITVGDGAQNDRLLGELDRIVR